MNLQTYIVITLLTVLLYYYVNMKKKYKYWTKKGIKGPKPFPIIGNFKNVFLLKQTVVKLFGDIYEQFPDEKVVGLYRGTQPVLLVRDPTLIKYVLIKDFNVFQDRGVKTSNNPLTDNLFSAEGEVWQVLRHKLTPIFTSKKLKEMTPLVDTCIDNFVSYVNHLVDNNIEIEIKSLTSMYTLQVIGSCAFGLDLDTFTEEETEFKYISKKIFNPSLVSRISVVLSMIIPGIRTVFGTSGNNELMTFFIKLIQNVIRERQDKLLTRRDFMDLMIELRQQGNVVTKKNEGIAEIKMTDNLIAAQALVFYSAGFETSASTMSFLFHELALNQDIQNRIHKEIIQVIEKHAGIITYEAIKEMTYLDMVFDEISRKHTVAGVLFRKCSKNYTFPGTEISIEKGTPIFISSQGLHNDPQYFANPDEFCPERFSAESKNKIEQCTYLPFGEGPRNCIGMRFAKVQSMMGTAAFLKNFKVIPNARTKARLEYDNKGLTLVSRDGIWLKIVKR